MKSYIGNDGFLRRLFDNKEFILADVFHYRSTAIKEAKAYQANGKTIKVGKAPEGLIGIWLLEEREK